MEATVKSSIPDLTQRLKSLLGSEAALFTVLRTVRDAGVVDELFALLESWSEAERGDDVPDRAMAELYFFIAQRSSGAYARELCRTALDLYPVHVHALALFEELADESFADELCARYQVFLEDAPFHDVPADARAIVLDKLVRAEREAALNEVAELRSGSNPSESPKSVDEASTTSNVGERFRQSPEKTPVPRKSDLDVVADRKPAKVLSIPSY